MSTVTQEKDYGHVPVLLHECLDALAIRPEGIYVDGTLGRAGHSLEIVRRLTAGGRLIALDRDETAIEAAQRRLADYMDRVTLVHSNFSALDDVLREIGVRGVDGMLFDLGVSSPQLDDAARGFSYKQDAPLDMRMDESAALTAREVVNTYSYEELRRILFEYGEERYAPAIAKRICRHREQKPIETTLELADIIRSAMPASALREKQHPAKRSFQAIRIAVNDELGAVRQGMEAAIDHLKPGGRLAVITFHSLEDRIVKNVFQDAAKGCTCPPEFPVCVCGKKPVEAELLAKLRAQMRTELTKIHKKVGTTFIYVTHDQVEAMTLGDRIVIMRDGFIQQIGTPQEVFNHPANLFVAGFIGMPQMNFYDAELVLEDGQYAVVLDGAKVTLPEEKQAKLKANGAAAGPITLGVRPEHLILSGDEGSMIHGTVDVSEMMGSAVHLHVSACGSDTIMIVPTTELESTSAFTIGSPIAFTFNGAMAHLFDRNTQKNLEV